MDASFAEEVQSKVRQFARQARAERSGIGTSRSRLDQQGWTGPGLAHLDGLGTKSPGRIRRRGLLYQTPGSTLGFVPDLRNCEAIDLVIVLGGGKRRARVGLLGYCCRGWRRSRTAACSQKETVRPEGAEHQWREDPPRELSVDLVADERGGGVTGRLEAS